MIKSTPGDLANAKHGRADEAKNSPVNASAQWELLVLQRTTGRVAGMRRKRNSLIFGDCMVVNFNAFARTGQCDFLLSARRP